MAICRRYSFFMFLNRIESGKKIWKFTIIFHQVDFQGSITLDFSTCVFLHRKWLREPSGPYFSTAASHKIQLETLNLHKWQVTGDNNKELLFYTEVLTQHMKVMKTYHSSKEWPNHSNGLDITALCVMRNLKDKNATNLTLWFPNKKQGLKKKYHLRWR